jgi:hypothetical protein
MKRTATISVLILTVIFRLAAQEVIVKAAFDTSRIYIGDQINYTVTIDQPSDLVLTSSQLKDTLCKNLEILSGPVIDSIINGSRLLISTKYLVTSFDSGFYQVPPYYAESKTGSGIKRFYSDYSLLEVMRVRIAPADTASKIFDIIEPYKAPVTIGEILPWIFIAIVASVLIWFIYKYLKRLRRDKTIPEIIIDPDPAHIIAFRDLEKLKGEQLWQKGEVKLYYSRLTEILRQYLENRYNISSLELTTSETLEALLRTGFKKDDLYFKLRTVLTGADLVKFAKYKPEPSENEDHYQSSWEFVDLTKSVDQSPEASDNKEGKEVSS